MKQSQNTPREASQAPRNPGTVNLLPPLSPNFEPTFLQQGEKHTVGGSMQTERRRPRKRRARDKSGKSRNKLPNILRGSQAILAPVTPLPEGGTLSSYERGETIIEESFSFRSGWNRKKAVKWERRGEPPKSDAPTRGLLSRFFSILRAAKLLSGVWSIFL